MGENMDENNSLNADFLMTLLIRFPELAAVKYEPETRSLKLTFLLRGKIREIDFKAAFDRIQAHLETFAVLTKKRPRLFRFGRRRAQDLTIIDFERDLATMSRAELSLLTALLGNEFGGSLVREETPFLTDDDLQLQDDVIQAMLDDGRVSLADKGYFAFRGQGRVLVLGPGSENK